jgi:hypothetical protein
MRLLATHQISHPSGNKYLRLYHGDLSRIPASEAVDVLVVSAFPSDYQPTRSSLIGALSSRGVSVSELSQDKEVDLRAAFSSWLSRDLSHTFPAVGFRRILCFESARHGAPPEAVGDIFRAIMPFVLAEPPIRSIAMPILAAGDQGHDPAVMLRAIFDASTHWLAAGLPLDVIKLVIFDAASVSGLRKVFVSSSRDQAALAQPTSGRRTDEDARYRFFVSYAHEDVSDVDMLVAALKAAKPEPRIFQDKLEIKVGQSWQDEMDRALASCRNVVVVYFPSYLASKVCMEEFNLARIRHRDSPVLLPILLRSTPLPLYMQSVEYIDCREADRIRLAAAAQQLTESAVA